MQSCDGVIQVPFSFSICAADPRENKHENMMSRVFKFRLLTFTDEDIQNSTGAMTSKHKNKRRLMDSRLLFIF